MNYWLNEFRPQPWYVRLWKFFRDEWSLQDFLHYAEKIKLLKKTVTLQIKQIDGEDYIAYDGPVLSNLTVKGNLRAENMIMKGRKTTTVTGSFHCGEIIKIDGGWETVEIDYDAPPIFTVSPTIITSGDFTVKEGTFIMTGEEE